MTHMYFSARTEGRISYGHLGRTNSCYYYYLKKCAQSNAVASLIFRTILYIISRTRHAGRHESGEGEEEHAEEETAGVVEDLGRLVADVHVQHADQNADRQVRHQSQPRQRLRTPHIRTLTVPIQLRCLHFQFTRIAQQR